MHVDSGAAARLAHVAVVTAAVGVVLSLLLGAGTARAAEGEDPAAKEVAGTAIRLADTAPVAHEAPGTAKAAEQPPEGNRDTGADETGADETTPGTETRGRDTNVPGWLRVVLAGVVVAAVVGVTATIGRD
ncbi:hypothetical protein [Egicoccus sp. AB-alg2]|uniref:hypothetical protein n=1 Tax=Egicoccus sp. AB-alg2 TaxID=3242693 RepID=UPI00359F0ED4